MADEAQVKELETALDSIQEFSAKRHDLITRSTWGEITFERIEKDVEAMFWLADEAKKLPTYIIPDGVVQDTIQHLSVITQIFNEIDDFRIAEGDPSSRRDDIVNRLRGQTQEVMSKIGLYLPLLALRAGEIENWTARMKEISDDGAQILRETTSYAGTRKKEIDETVQAARAAAGEAGAAEFTHEFREEAKDSEKRSKRWLWPAGIFAGLALLGAISLIYGWLGDAPTNTWEAVYRLSGRVIALSVLFHAAIWSGRIVLANMHLASVNKHRAVSLQTLQAFHSAAADAAAKDAVVLEAARAVYENVPSGYLGRQVNERGGNARTLEIIRGANRIPQVSDEGRPGS